MEYLRYHSFLNAISKEFGKSFSNSDPKTKKRLLALTIRMVDAFAEIYGDHELKMASNPVSEKLAATDLSMN